MLIIQIPVSSDAGIFLFGKIFVKKGFLSHLIVT